MTIQRISTYKSCFVWIVFFLIVPKINAVEVVNIRKYMPVKINTVSHQKDDTSNEIYKLDAEFINRWDFDIWIVIANPIDEKLNRKYIYKKKITDEFPVKVEKANVIINENKTEISIIKFAGEKNSSFCAFYLRKGQKLKFNSFKIRSHSIINEMEIWEVKELFVNGKIKISEWILLNGLLKNVDGSNTSRENSQVQNTEKLDYIKADVKKKWLYLFEK